MTLSPEQKQKARGMLDAFHGFGPGGKLNYGYADGYYRLHIEHEFGMDIDRLKEATGWTQER